jgi:hypothetical protein
MEFLRKTNPWRSKKDIDDERMLEQMEAGAGREQGARALINWAKAMKAAQGDTSRTIDDED